MVEKLKQVRTLKGWRTLGINAAALLPVGLDVLGSIVNIPEIKGIIPQEYVQEYAVALGVVNIFLRLATSTPVGKKY